MSDTIPIPDLLDAVATPLLFCDRSCRVVFLNRRAESLIGLHTEQAAGLPCALVLRHRICAEGCPALSSGEGPRRAVETDMLTWTRQRIPVRVTINPVFGPEGDTLGFCETLEDLRSLQGREATGPQAQGFGPLLGRSPAMERVFEALPLVAQSDAPVLITGESGTGKDMLAEVIHQASPRANGPFVKVHCAALPPALLDIALFGSALGSAGAGGEERPGKIRLANQGTLFIGEIGDMPLPLQAKLVALLDEGLIRLPGEIRGTMADVRLIAASYRDMETMVREGHFREDLFFRLGALRLALPPLRERQGDLRLLMDHFLRFFSQRLEKEIQGFSQAALGLLLRYPYPGNVRELRHILEYAVSLCQGEEILPDHLPSTLTEPVDAPGPPQDQRPASGEEGRDTKSWEEAERTMILQALRNARGNRGRAALALGWGRTTLWRKMKTLGLQSF